MGSDDAHHARPRLKDKGLLMLIIVLALANAAEGRQGASMIFWENQHWDGSGNSERLTLWADGRSEIAVKRRGEPHPPKKGWTATHDGQWTVYRRMDVYPPGKVNEMLTAAISAGIERLKSFPPGYSDGSGTLVGVESSGQVTKIVIPLFLHEVQSNNKGSENHKRYLAVEKAIGEFDTDAMDQ